MLSVLIAFLGLVVPSVYAGKGVALDCENSFANTTFASDPKWLYFSRDDLHALSLDEFRGRRMVVNYMWRQGRQSDMRTLDGIVTQVRGGRGLTALSFVLADGRATVPVHEISELYLFLENQQTPQEFAQEFADYSNLNVAKLDAENAPILEGKRVAVLLTSIRGRTIQHHGILTSVVIHRRHKPRWGLGNSKIKRDPDSPELPFRVSFTLLQDDQSKVRFSSDDLVKLRWRSLESEFAR